MSPISLTGIVKTARNMALMTEALDFSTKHRRSVAALLQQEPEVPMEDSRLDATGVIQVQGQKLGFEEKAKEPRLMESES